MDHYRSMKICFPTFWSKGSGINYSAPVLDLNDLVPGIGQHALARFDHHEPITIGETLQTQQGFIHLDRLAWDEVTWAGSATVEEFTYLNAITPHEAFMELIVKVIGNEVIGLFSLHIDPGGVLCRMGGTPLTGADLTTFKRTLAIARPLHDTQAPYLA